MQFYNLKKAFGIYLSLIFVLLFSACADGQDFSRYDLASDEGVNQAIEALRGKKLSNYGRGCIKRPAQLPKIILVGTFAHDRGCMLDGAFIKKYFLSRQDENFSIRALESLGWRKAGFDQRQKLALEWTRLGLLAFDGYPLADKADAEDFAGREFQAPQTATDEDKNTSVTLWTRLPMGMKCQTRYQRLSFIFAADGSLKERKNLDSFSIPCKRN
ncbi:MAG TPA: hypothetical protein VF599_12840 [Pyrinomonadaceae bacterium]|jgi:hypothetical protein